MFRPKLLCLTSFFILLLQMVNSHCFSQKDFISGVIIDRDTELPIPFANVGVKNKFIGTVSDSLGYFMVEARKLSETDTIQFTRLGYKLEYLLVEELLAPKSEPLVILLQQKLVDLNEFTLEAASVKGVRTYGGLTLKSRFAFAFNPKKSRISENFGREVAVEIEPKKKAIRLNAVKFVLANNQIDHLVFRVNIYREPSDLNGMPGSKIIERIFSVNNKSKGEQHISFIGDEIVLAEKFWVSIEFLDSQDENEFGIVTVPVKFPFGKMYTRESSLGEWKRGSGAPSILIEAEVLEP